MKNLTAAALVAMSLSLPAQAGSLADPVIEKTIVVEETTSSSSGTMFVLFLGVVLALPILAAG
ncbi:hypothetical protein [Pseudooceanicola sp.]|uniref:hypothetical protein n=1 Tax=Pseudooceanicola sp. TaxID=1914328 RepID=UPI002617983D|nr:hypothetical protein [Pseudooceanicola sp.]MDF1853862.1 hypothetical protein [Pseudooceanicola sp.]